MKATILIVDTLLIKIQNTVVMAYMSVFYFSDKSRLQRCHPEVLINVRALQSPVQLDDTVKIGLLPSLDAVVRSGKDKHLF